MTLNSNKKYSRELAIVGRDYVDERTQESEELAYDVDDYPLPDLG